MKWIKLSDEKPKHSGCYYVAENNQVYTRHYSASEDFWHDGDLENLNNLHPTHWMPLPDPPEARVRFYPTYTDETFDGTVIEEKPNFYVVIPDQNLMLRQNWDKRRCDVIR